jgi:ABC-2 type transport system ATP-binding protein
VETYSLGMRQRLGLAAALLGNPDVLALDEPANGLDPEGIADLRTIIRAAAADGTTVLVASHVLAEIEKVCTHAAILAAGRLVACGEVESLLAATGHSGLEAAFLALVKDRGGS